MTYAERHCRGTAKEGLPPSPSVRGWNRGEVDIAELIQFEGIFAPLQDHTEFLRVRVDAELGTICWPNGADLDPDVLYAKITGEAISVSQPLELRERR